jgi:hypothetical protein
VAWLVFPEVGRALPLLIDRKSTISLSQTGKTYQNLRPYWAHLDLPPLELRERPLLFLRFDLFWLFCCRPRFMRQSHEQYPYAEYVIDCTALNSLPQFLHLCKTRTSLFLFFIAFAVVLNGF